MFKSCKVKIKNDQIWTYTVFRKPRASNLNIFYVCLYIRSHFYAFPFLLHSSFKKSSIFLSSSSLLIDPYSIKCNKKTSFFWLIIKISSNYMDYHDPLTLGCLFRSYRVFIKYCVFSLKFVIFLNSASSAAALVFDLPLCTLTDSEGKPRKARVRSIS